MTRRAVVPVRTRMLRIARALIEGREVTSIWIRREFGVCRVQAGATCRLCAPTCRWSSAGAAMSAECRADRRASRP
jgi:hypothetical protein